MINPVNAFALLLLGVAAVEIVVGIVSVPDEVVEVVEVVKVPRLLELVPFTRVYTCRDSGQRGEGERGLFFAIIYIVRALVFLASPFR